MALLDESKTTKMLSGAKIFCLERVPSSRDKNGIANRFDISDLRRSKQSAIQVHGMSVQDLVADCQNSTRLGLTVIAPAGRV
jgi:hypothetical protein